MAAYPVTYAQYKAFLDAGDGYRSERWWEDLKREAAPGRQLRPYASYPADNVSWYDATAFCRWLSHGSASRSGCRTNGSGSGRPRALERVLLTPGGRNGATELANTVESGIGRTTAVGMYPGGQSLQGIHDLAGDVWEWCRNEYEHPSKNRAGDDVSRVVRGGSWASIRSTRARTTATTGPGLPLRLPRFPCGVRVPHPLTAGALVTGH